MSTCPLPVRATVRDVLADLLGRDVDVSQAAPQTLAADQPAYAATYVWDDGGVAAVGIWELPLAAGAGAAIGMATAEDAAAAVTAGALSDEQRDFFHEVANVLAKLLNSPETPHVKLRGLDVVPGPVPRDMAALVLQPHARQDYAVTVEGYGEGTLTLLA
ncbi:MAG TPA: hypothetical protein VIK95_06570 [Egibacteraceae bacterium]